MTTNERYDVFLSYSSVDRLLVQQVAEQLTKRGCSCFLDQWYLLPVHDWVVALEKALAASRSVAVFLGPHEMGRWQQRERAWALDRVDRKAGDARFAVIPVLLPGCAPPLGFLGQFTWIDLRDDPENARQLDRLAAAIRGEAFEREGQREPRATVCPYRGLLPFREEDAAFFFGREPYIEQLLAKVAERPLVAVVGASGSGKSSVVRAGLVPKLRSGGRRPVWDIVTIVPGEHPLHALADGLLPLVEPDLTGLDLIRKRNLLADDLKQAKVPLWDVAVEALRRQPGTDRLLLVVDQWEELYTQCADAAERRRFIDELLDATGRRQSSLSVVLTVRSDFYTEVLLDRPLLDRLQDAKLDLGPMNGAELRAIIEQPAKLVGLTFQDGLVQRILDDASEVPGRLPLLEFALEELWQRRDGVELTHAAYEALGRLSGAIATHAEAVYGKLNAAEQAAAPRLFRRLVRAGAKTEEDTRRRADLRVLDAPTQRVARRLADERLLVTSRTTTGDEGQELVEVAHEELLRRWARLGKWVNEDRRFLQWRGRLVPLLEEHGRDPSFVLRGGAVREARQFYPSRQDELEPQEIAFLQASSAAERRRKLTLWGSVAAALLLVAGVFTAVRVSIRNAQNRETVTAAVTNLPGTPPTDVSGVLKNLLVLPPFAAAELQKAYAAANDPHAKLRLAFGLIAVEAVNSADHEVVEFIVDQVSTARADDSANVIEALSHLTERQQVVQEILHHADQAADATVRARYMAAALSLGETSRTTEILTPRADANGKVDPQKRELFIRDFPAWPGDLERIAKLLLEHDDSDFRSGLCAAVGGVDIRSRSAAERGSIEDALIRLYQESPDGGTHSAADWALRQWKTALPRLEECESESDRQDWTAHHSWYVNGLGMTMLRIPGGKFRMGSEVLSDAKPHNVTVSEFWMSDCEVTNGQFQALVNYRKTENLAGAGEKPSDANRPVGGVTWFDAVKFCNELSRKDNLHCYYNLEEKLVEKLAGYNSITVAEVTILNGIGYRLPTEPEWEYACRARTTTLWSCGDDESLLERYSVYNRRQPDVCGARLPNGWGLFDMHGNVEEWCADWYDEKYHAQSPPEDPQGLSSRLSRVIRGGGWSTSAEFCWSACRSWDGLGYRPNFAGFRVARSLSGKSSPGQPVQARAEPGAKADAAAGR